MIVVDTNVDSELMRQAPEPWTVRWSTGFQPKMYLSPAVTAAELRYGVARLPQGRRRRALYIKIDGLLTEDFRHQILPFDAPAATRQTTCTESTT